VNCSASARLAAAVLLTPLFNLIGSTVQAQTTRPPVRASVLLASDYRSHGVSQNRNDAAWRLTLDYEQASGLFVGGFAANVDYQVEDGREHPRDVLLDFYGGYVRRGDRWSASVALSQYGYPGSGFDYDYRQLLVNISLHDRYFLDAGYTDDWLGLGSPARHFELGLAWPLPRDLEVSVGTGRFRLSAARGMSFSHWNAGLSRPLGRFAVDLRYYDNGGDGMSLLGDSTGESWVLSLSYAIAPR
jgi:uncharacterized protein (TIGR02001 family)